MYLCMYMCMICIYIYVYVYVYVYVCICMYMLILEPMMILKEALMTCGDQVFQSIEALLNKVCSQLKKIPQPAIHECINENIIDKTEVILDYVK